MRKIMVKLFLVMSLALPVYVSAQEADTPTPDSATLEATQTPDVVTATSSPTPDVTATPLPPVEPPPIDQTKVFESVFSVVMALVVGAVMIGITGIVGLLLLLAPPIRAMLMGGIKVGIDEAGKVAERTETPLDNLAVAEFRKQFLILEERLRLAEEKGNATEVLATKNASDIAVQSQQLGNR